MLTNNWSPLPQDVDFCWQLPPALNADFSRQQSQKLVLSLTCMAVGNKVFDFLLNDILFYNEVSL